ncbi:unnamed protein product [Amoebophrya sp. A25]|nr:unnamed protein product [Amoebophrya sp. A25]|eukprot:GSA25T00018255001.1
MCHEHSRLNSRISFHRLFSGDPTTLIDRTLALSPRLHRIGTISNTGSTTF